jgi:hypothetical protein
MEPETGVSRVVSSVPFDAFSYLQEFQTLAAIESKLPLPLIRLARQVRVVYPFIQLLLHALDQYTQVSESLAIDEIYSYTVGPFIRDTLKLLHEGKYRGPNDSFWTTASCMTFMFRI